MLRDIFSPWRNKECNFSGVSGRPIMASMQEPDKTLPQELLTRWPKLQSAHILLRRWNRRGGIIFMAPADEALTAARQVAAARNGKTIELSPAKVLKDDFNKELGRFIDGSLTEKEVQFAGMDRLCIIIPRIDKQPKWLRESLKGYCDRLGPPVVFLLTCPDLDWMPSSLEAILHACRKTGRPRNPSEQPEESAPPRATDDSSARTLFDAESDE